MISKEVFDSVCDNAKIRLDYEGSDFVEISNFLKDVIDKIHEIQLDENAQLLNLELTNTFREDTPKPSLSRKDVLSTTEYIEAGCVSVPANLREA